ncbi:MAG: FlgD immunoglobulin-like domain containing protein, partial [Candidatus Marinimicrobia bacterium]|nr:FlgD immunoglobulin-like domain containing protein [Candidatus Neomarinimicrobiota bacterium]
NYDLPEDALVNITIYDMMGRQVKTLINSEQTAGYRTIRWNGTNYLGQTVSAGLYMYVIQAGAYRKTRKMVLLK